ncbi:restriction endonuclease subunit S [Weizmannia sp. FSL W8-1119]|uniref:restriction endonuclease subunit S n=1 Tax=Weizmannia sp. FSL W8-1119 TaxID=2954709 RepID=UPI0030FA2762
MRKKQKTMEELLEEALVPEKEQPYEVPGNWVWVKSGYIAKWGSGGTPSRKKEEYYKGNIPWIKTGELRDNVILDSEEKISEEALKKSSAKLFPKDSVAIAMYGATIGKLGILGIDAATNQACAVGVPHFLMDKDFMFYYFFYQRKTLIDLGKGGAQPNISQTIIKDFPHLLPPLKEQKRIVNKIKQLLSKIDEAKRLIEEAKETFELRRAAILDKAFRGELTRKWREENKNIEDAESLYVKIKESQSIRRKVSKEINIKDLRYSIPSTWKWVRLGDVFTITSGGTPKRTIPEYYEGNIPWIKTGEIKWNAINESEEQITPEAVANSSAKLLPPNTVLVAMYGQGLTRGRAAILSVEATCNQAVCALLPNDYIAPEFIFYYFMEGYQRFRQVAKGGNQENLSVSLISDFIFPLPPLEEQRVIITTLQNIFKKESKIKDVIKINTDEIKQSILSKAFRGELGTNDPTEESAIELLKEVLQEQVK